MPYNAHLPNVSLLPGTRVGAYEILAAIGAGGMGEVYKARDTRLKRNVAIKALPETFASDPERLTRFQREAEVLASLNHPNIAHIHGLEEAGGVRALVMEFVEGEDLAQKIARRPIPIGDALPIARQIAEALEAAHGQGIIHRDLKPANIKVRDDGTVKVLDFGLAKLVDRSDPSNDETFMQRLTEESVVVGTVHYMSPEQAEGQRLDARSDIFSFGTVLYEMLTGQRPFDGNSRLSTIAKILSEDPKPVAQLAPTAPPDLAKIVARCLRKNAARRFQHMADVKVALEDVQEEFASRPQATARRRGLRWPWLAGGAAVVITVAAVGYAGWRTFRARVEPSVPRVVQLTTLPGSEKCPTFSPEGEQLAFTWSGPNQDNDDVYIQRIGSAQPFRLTTDPAVDFSPAWSPDGLWIAFLRGEVPGRSELRLIPPLGGAERRIAQLEVRDSFVDPPFLSWFPDSRSLVVVHSPGPGEPESLFIVSTESGEKRRLTAPPSLTRADRTPAVSPDGRSVVFDRGGELHVLSLNDDGAPAGVVQRLTDSSLGAQQPAWSRDNKEIFFSARRRLWRLPIEKSQSPMELPFVGPDAFLPTLSRGRGSSERLIFVRATLDPNIWRLELSGVPRRASSPPVLTISSTQGDSNPQFSPDGGRVAFYSNRSGTDEIWVADADGANPAQLTSMGEGPTGTPRWSPDGQIIAFDSRSNGNWDIYVVPAAGGKHRQMTFDAADDHVPSFSKDGKSLYFSSNRTGVFQIWKVPIAGGEPTPVTRNTGFVAFESVDGTHLYYTQTSTGPSSLWRLPTGGGDAIKLLDGVAERAFGVLETGIYYVEQRSAPTRAPHVVGVHGRPHPRPTGTLRFFEFSSRRSTTVADLGDRVSFGLTVAPNGRTVLFSRDDSAASDLVLVENFR